MKINPETRIGDIVKASFKTAQVFDKNKIDFCCGGGISLEEACRKSDVDMNKLLPELESILTINDPDSRYIESLEPDELCEYIEKRHHSYIKDNIPFLLKKLYRLCEVHGDKHPELFEVREMFEGATSNLMDHMKKEELFLFPYIRKMVKLKKNRIDPGNEFGEVKKTIDLMEEEHYIEGRRFERMSDITDNFTCPPDGCNTYKVTYQYLQDFEQDLHRHIHLENNILFRKALILEQQLTIH